MFASRPKLLVFAALFALVSLTGCKGPCRELSEKLCECETNTLAKDACKRRVSNEASRVSPSEADEAVCEGLLEGCDCNLIETTQGKIACGLARERPAGVPD